MRKRIDFSVMTDRSGLPQQVDVSIYSSLDDMHSDARRFNLGNSGLDDRTNNSVALCQSYVKWKETQQGEIRNRRQIIRIRYQKDRLGSGVMAHEIAHAALRIYEHHVMEEQGSPFEEIEQEEIFCHIIGELSAKIVNGMYKRNVFDKETWA